MLFQIRKRRGMLVAVYCQRTPSKLCRAEGSSVSPPVWPSCGTLQHYLNGLLFYIPWILRPLQEPRIHWTFAECRQKGWTHDRVQKYPSPSSFQSIITHCCHWSAGIWLFESLGYFSSMDSMFFARVPVQWTFAGCRQKGWTHSSIQKYPSH